MSIFHQCFNYLRNTANHSKITKMKTLAPLPILSIFTLILFTVNVSLAQKKTLVIHDSLQMIGCQPISEIYFKEASSSVGYNNIKNNLNEFRLLVNTNSIKGGPYKRAYWFYLSIENRRSDLDPIFIFRFGCKENDCPISKYDFIDIYQDDTLHYNAGLATNYNKRSLKPFWHTIEVKIPHGETSKFFIRIKNIDSTYKRDYVPFCITTKTYSLNDAYTIFFKERRFNLFNMAFIGIISFIFFFTLVQYIQHLDKIYLYYLGYLFSLLVYHWRDIDDGINSLFFFAYIKDWHHYFQAPSTSAVVIFYIVFVLAILDFDDDKRTIIILKGCVAITLTFLMLELVLNVLWDLEVAYEVYLRVRWIYLVILLTSIVFVLFRIRTPYTIYVYVLIGSLALVVAALFNITLHRMELQGVLLGRGLFYMRMGILIEVLCFSLALGYKYKIVQDQKLKAERIARSTQIDTHFLSNAFTAVLSYVKEKNIVKIETYIKNLADITSYILAKADDEDEDTETTLEEELEYAEKYLDMWKILIQNFEYNISVKEVEDAGEILIPSLLLQPVLENAMKHGFENLHSEIFKNLKLTVEREGKHIQIVIDDDGIGREASQKRKIKDTKRRKSFGLSLTKDRLMAFDNKARLSVIDKNNPSGTIVIFKFTQKYKYET